MSPTAKVTYISLSADDPALDAAFDSAIADVRAALGRRLPAARRGRRRAPARAPIESRSPTDARVVVARVATATEADVRDAVAAARAAFPRWSATPLAGARRDPRPRRRHRARAALRARRPGSSSRWARTGSRRSARSRRPPTCSTTTPTRCGRTTATCARWGGWCPPTEHQRAAPVRRVGGHRALELPLRAARRARRGGAGHRQHRGDEAVVRDAALGRQAGRDLRAGRPAARRPQLPAGQRPRRGRRPAGSPGRRRGDLHRLVRRRLRTALPEVRPRLPQALHRRDGRQEPGHRHGQRRHRAGRAGRVPLGLRHERAQVLGLLAGLRAPRRSPTSSSTGW